MTTPVVVSPRPAAAMVAAGAAPARRRFTAAEYEAMIAAGILSESIPVALRDGDIMLLSPPAPFPTRRRFTVAEYYRMADAGILAWDSNRPADRVELLDGDVIQMAPIGDWHSGAVNRCGETLYEGLRRRATVSIQNPVRLDDGSEPQPDIMLLRRRADFYSSAKPAPADVLLLIEISDTSLAYDRGSKLAAYARAGIPEVWIASRDDRRVEAYTEPAAGRYSNIRHFAPGDRIAPQAFPDLQLAVSDLIPAGDAGQ